MYGAGSIVFAVWSYCIAKARPPSGSVELNPKVLSHTIGEDEQKIIEAIDYLLMPDPNSRSKTKEGKRLVKVGQFEYELVNFLPHRLGSDEEERKRYFREKQREYRKRLSNNVKQDVLDSGDTITQAEAEAEANIHKDDVCIGATPSQQLSTISPSLKKVQDECFKQGMTDQDGERIHAHYQKKSWVDGAGQPLTDLSSTVTAWRLNPRRQTEQQSKSETIQEQAERLRKAGEL